MPSLLIEGLRAGYGPVGVLHDVSLEVRDGELVVLLGTNGNGKSTLMKCIMGLVRPSAGRIVYRPDSGPPVDLEGVPDHARAALGIAMIAEGRRLFPKLTVEENLVLGAYPAAARGRVRQNLAAALDAFPALASRRRQLAGSMSGGQQQMLAIARALMAEPRLLLVDEPSVGLSPALVAGVIATIAELKASRGLTVLMAEQNFEGTAGIADRGYVLVHGEIAFAADRIEDLRANDIVQALYFGT